ncbi:TolA protein [hydrothermal vent metagenome]|uniref:TolA protein n=1 Tax=hydrothermal vent metagenome TaxID=652676 RepID=A0A1W1EEX5_9ZZZZ
MRKNLLMLCAAVSMLILSGCGKEPSLDNIKEKIVKVETPNGKYTTVNKSSGAYGRYQIMPKTAKVYTRKLNISHREWKKPKNQEKIFIALLQDNIVDLKRHGIEVNAFSVYGAHQQGARGFINIMTKDNLSRKSYMRLRRNLPRKYRNVDIKDLRKTWINYWKNRMVEV